MASKTCGSLNIMDAKFSETCKSSEKLLPGELVEVRQPEIGLRGSWHPGVVIKVKPGRRFVEYDELLNENGSEKLIECIAVSRRVDGAKVPARLTHKILGKKERGFIRPRPPPCPRIAHDQWKRGLWVDAFYEDAWWEGVMMEDLLGSDFANVKIFFPDEGDEATIPLTGLRIAREWDEESGLWRLKGQSEFFTEDQNLESDVTHARISESHFGVEDVPEITVQQSLSSGEDSRLAVDDPRATNIVGETVQANVSLTPLHNGEDVALSKDVSQNADEEVADRVGKLPQADVPLMSLQNDKDIPLSKDTSENLDRDVKAAEGFSEAIQVNASLMPLHINKDGLFSEDITENGDEGVEATDNFSQVLQANAFLMSVQNDEDPALSKDISKNHLEVMDMFSEAIPSDVSFNCLQNDEDIALPKVSSGVVELSKTFSENADKVITATDIDSEEIRANKFLTSLQNDSDAAFSLDISQNADGKMKDEDMYSEAIQENVSLKSLPSVMVFASPRDNSDNRERTPEVVNWSEVNWQDLDLFKETPGELKSSSSIDEDVHPSENITRALLMKTHGDLSISKNTPENVNFHEDISEDVDFETPKDIAEDETLAEWMELEKLRVAGMRKSFSSQHHFETEQVSEQGQGRGRGRGRGRGSWRGSDRLGLNVVPRLDGSRSSDRDNWPTSQFLSEAGVKLGDEDMGHKENQDISQHKENEGGSKSSVTGSKCVSSEVIGISPKVLREARFRAKMILLKAGYSICFRPRTGKAKQEAYYVSPEGRAFYSLLAASNYWKLHTALPISVEENNTMQLVNMYKFTKYFVPDPTSCKKKKKKKKMNRLLKMETKQLKVSKAKCLGRSGRMFTASEGDADVLNAERMAVTRGVGGIRQIKAKMARRHKALCKGLATSKFHNEKIHLRQLAKNRERKHRSLDQNLVLQPSKRLKGVSGYSGKGQVPKKTSSRLRSACRLEVLLSPHGGGEDDSETNQTLKKRTVLSWLIDMAVIEENEKVQYTNGKGGAVMLEGWVTREGILCNCCNAVLRVSVFEAHAGSKLHRPSANIRVKDGRSLLECQVQALNILSNRSRSKKEAILDDSDDTCGVCGDGGELICCDRCPSTFHLTCVAVEDIPKGEWYCPNCRCTLCGGSEFHGAKDCFNDLTVLFCGQCERKYHVGCLNAKGFAKMDHCPKGSWFCRPECEEIFQSLQARVGCAYALEDGFSWTLLHSTEGDNEDDILGNIEANAECNSKLALALGVMQECFRPMIDGRTQIDIIGHVVYNQGADLSRLNFRGFYTVLLERGDEIISVACMRIHGPRLAEMPLIGTRFQYRRQGMCRRLLNAIEGMLEILKIKTFVLPAVPDLMETWTGGFGFQSVSAAQRLQLAELNILTFPGSMLLRKNLDKCTSSPTKTCPAEPQLVKEGENSSKAANRMNSATTSCEHDCRHQSSSQTTSNSQISPEKVIEDVENDLRFKMPETNEDVPRHPNDSQEILPRVTIFQVNHIDASEYEIAEISDPNFTDIFVSSDIPKLGIKPIFNGLQRSEDMEETVDLFRCAFDFASSKALDKDNVSLPIVPGDIYAKSLNPKLNTIKGTC